MKQRLAQTGQATQEQLGKTQQAMQEKGQQMGEGLQSAWEGTKQRTGEMGQQAQETGKGAVQQAQEAAERASQATKESAAQTQQTVSDTMKVRGGCCLTYLHVYRNLQEFLSYCGLFMPRFPACLSFHMNGDVLVPTLPFPIRALGSACPRLRSLPRRPWASRMSPPWAAPGPLERPALPTRAPSKYVWLRDQRVVCWCEDTWQCRSCQ